MEDLERLVHEPPLGLLEQAFTHPALRVFRERIQEVIELLENRELEAGAGQFIETIAFGPGAREYPSEGRRQTFIRNAPTFLDEQRNPERSTIDLLASRGSPRPRC